MALLYKELFFNARKYWHDFHTISFFRMHRRMFLFIFIKNYLLIFSFLSFQYKNTVNFLEWDSNFFHYCNFLSCKCILLVFTQKNKKKLVSYVDCEHYYNIILHAADIYKRINSNF